MAGSLTIRNVTALLGTGCEPARVDLEIRSGSIDRIGPPGEAAEDGGFSIDGTGLIASPGFVDVHDHFRELAPGLPLAQGLPIDEYLKVKWSTLAELGAAEYEAAALLGATQRARSGVTTVVDHVYPFHRPGLDEAVVAGYRRAGVRWRLARGIMTRPDPRLSEPWETAAGRIRALVASGRAGPGDLFVAPVSIRQASLADYERAVGLADELGCGLYTHVAETDAERESWIAEAGEPPIRALDAAGFLTGRTVLVHCVVLDPGDIGLIAARGAHVVHCPGNHMKLGKGIAPVPEMLDAGVNVALGIDTMQDMFTEMRMELGMHAVARRAPGIISPARALQMATAAGARAAGVAGGGVIAAGAPADLVLLDGRALETAPLLDPRYAVVYQAHPGMVRHVVAGGEVVVRDGRSTRVDEAALRDEVEKLSAHWLRRTGLEFAPWYAGGGGDGG